MPVHRILRRVGLTLVLAVVASAAALIPATPAGAGEPSVVIQGGGWGHGVGMGQYGAEGQGRQGRSATQILQHYYTGATVSTAGPWSDVRVLLAERSTTVELRPAATRTLIMPNGSTKSVPGGSVVKVGRDGGNRQVVKVDEVQVPGSPFAGAVRTRLQLSGTRATVAGVGEYRWGQIEVSNGVASCGGGQCVVARNMTMDQYLYGLAEVPSSWTAAALQAQAVAGRSYAAIRMASPRVPGLYNLVATVFDQYYAGWPKENPANGGTAWVNAVNATSNKVLKVNGNVVQAFYSSTTGGRTENSEYVWSSYVSYLRSVADPTDNISPRHSWSRTYTLKEIGSWFGVANVRDIKITGSVGVSGRVDKADIKIVGDTTKTVKGTTFRSTVNSRVPDSRDLWSTKFRIASISWFSDVPPNAYYAPAVGWLSTEGITTGVGDTGLFKPNDPVNRAQMVVFLWRMMGEPTGYPAHGFPDVPSGSWYDQAVRWAKATKLTTGVGDTGLFKPTDVVNRAQMAVLLHRVSGLKAPTTRHPFPDVPAGSWYDKAVSWAYQYGITTGVGDTGLYKPSDWVTRGQMAALLYRTAGKASAWAAPLPPTAP